MTATNDFKTALILFNEKADKLLRLSFVETMFKTNTGVTLSWTAREDGQYDEVHVRQGPQEEAIDAFVLTFRYFIQDNEATSFRKMAQSYADAPIGDSFKTQFAEIRETINSFLDSPPDFQIQYNGKTYSRREIIDIFVYGGLSHANPSKKTLYDEWMLIPPFKPLAENEFVYAISCVLRAIEWIKDLNSQVLKQLDGV